MPATEVVQRGAPALVTGEPRNTFERGNNRGFNSAQNFATLVLTHSW